METKTCIVCGATKKIKKFDFGAQKNRRNICEPCRNKRKRIALWLQFLKAFDYKCQCCGEQDIRFLTLDHVQNDGADCSSNNITELRRVKELNYNREIFNCLCWNCNCGRAANKGICPHKDIPKELYLTFYKNKLIIAPEETGKKGRQQIYTGDKHERNMQAQSSFKIKNTLKAGATNIDIAQVLKVLSSIKTE